MIAAEVEKIGGIVFPVIAAIYAVLAGTMGRDRRA